METLLVSACLLGLGVRFDGKEKAHPKVLALRQSYNLIPICPEIYGGLPTPRPPAEIQGSKVINILGQDVTCQYRAGAQASLKICQISKAKGAILKARSPSCGLGQIYDGTFTGTLIKGDGLTARLLKEHGIKVLSEEDL